ncbi:cytochrome c [Pseudorhodobacter turbinis]|uniref:Cytochrome c n=1 Tax=Pseudorhodobacter turbinis TaxID=2500533 RepID=A0A4P8EH03_9RHOB|nr:cytochrome c [Pseudorhodobacter turbinis]QCO56022.1 cytochrome c [Pseudorhodobacter turbinis]
MRFVAKALILGLTLTAGAAIAKEGVENPTVKARMDVMGIVGANTKVLGDMAQGKAAFDASAASAAQAALAAAAAEIPAVFEEEADDPVSEARPDIWMNMEGFVEKAEALETAANAMDVSSVEGVQAGMGAIGGSCKSCHSDFRAKK